jgi:hypothetical protein
MLPLTMLVFSISLGQPSESPNDLANWIDAKLEASWRAKSLPPREMAGDELFLRRAYLELNGTIPSVSEARDFLGTSSPGKRQQLIRNLLDNKRYSEHFAGLWARTLAPVGESRGPLEMWLKDEFRTNRPVDQMVRSMLTASGDSTRSGPAGFYFAVGNSPERVAEAVGRGLLGVRLGCAQCHNHPLASWKREDFWGLAAFFAGTGNTPGRVGDSFVVKITPTDSAKEYVAKFLEGPEPQFAEGRSPRVVLSDWLVSKQNPYFVANIVNRVWQDLCGTALVSSVDDLDTVSAEERQLILDELAAKFAASGFDLRWLIEGICLSKAYQQVSSATVETGTARRPVRTLSPEQVFATLDQALSLKKGRGVSPRYTPEGMTLRQKLEEARGSSPTDFKGGIPQALLLMNGTLVSQATTLEESMTLRAVLEAPFLKESDKLDTLFLAAYSRLPRQAERERLTGLIQSASEPKQAYANIFWAMLNSPEFLLCP